MSGEKDNQPGQKPDPAQQPSENEGLNLKDDLDRAIEGLDYAVEDMQTGEKPEDYLRRTGREDLPQDAPNLGGEGSNQPGTGALNSGGDAGGERAPGEDASGSAETTRPGEPAITASTPGVDIAKYVSVDTGGEQLDNPPPDTQFIAGLPIASSMGALPEPRPNEPVSTGTPVMSYINDEDVSSPEYGLSEETLERNTQRRTVAKAAAVVGVLLILAAGAFVVLGGGGDSTDSISGGNQQSGGQAAAAATIAAAKPTIAPAGVAATATATPAPPAGPTSQQLKDANISAADLPAFYGNCATEFTAQNDTNVQQSVSSSADMVTAMGAAAFAGVRSASRSTAACAPYNVASVMGRAKGVPEAEALFDAAVLNYGQKLFNNVATFGATGAWDESHCQNGAFPPQNIIAVACWVREGDFVGGFFYLLPPNSPQPAIDEGRRDALAFLQRIAALIAR